MVVFEHAFPAPHLDSVESVIDYRVPPEQFTPLAAFDGSVRPSPKGSWPRSANR